MEQISDRVVMVKILTEPKAIVIVQVYMPTSGHDDEEVEKVYENIDVIIEKVKGEVTLIILRNWKAVVGEGDDGKIIGKFGLGQRNNRGTRLKEFCEEYRLFLVNTIISY